MVWHGVKYGWLRDLAGPLILEHFWRQVRGAVLPLPTKQQRELFNFILSLPLPSTLLTYFSIWRRGAASFNMLLSSLSLLALCLASASSPVSAITAGSLVDGGNSLVSAMMVRFSTLSSPLSISTSCSFSCLLVMKKRCTF